MPKAAKKAAKTPKDPNKPKKPSTSYVFFNQAHRAVVRQQHPDATFGEIGKYCGEAWKQMSDADKAPYEKMAKQDKTRYERQMQNYVAPAMKNGKFKKEGPKRGKTSYVFYCQATRDTVVAQNPGATFGEIGKILGNNWKLMSDAEKEVYEKMAAKDRSRYEKELAKFEAKKRATLAASQVETDEDEDEGEDEEDVEDEEDDDDDDDDDDE